MRHLSRQGLAALLSAHGPALSRDCGTASSRKETAMDVKPQASVLIDGRKLAYDEGRRASPADEKGTILLLTGLGSKRLGWARQLDVFGREYRTIAMDHRDTGDSDEATADYTVADLADDAAAL